MKMHVKKLNPDELIEAARKRDTGYEFRFVRAMRLWIDRKIIKLAGSHLFQLLYSSRWERVLKYWTVVSILAISIALGFETWFPGSRDHFDTRLIDVLLFLLILGETVIRAIRLEFLPSFARVIVRTYGSMTVDDIRRFRLLKLILFRLDIVVLAVLVFYLFGYFPVDPVYMSVARLLRIVAVLRAFDIPLMKDLTAVILSAFESMGLVFIALGMHVFVYSVVGTVLFGAAQPTYFGDLPTSINTLLFPLVNRGNSPAMVALCKECGDNTVVQIMYFSSFLWIGGVILLGLLTSIAREKVAQFKRRAL